MVKKHKEKYMCHSFILCFKWEFLNLGIIDIWGLRCRDCPEHSKILSIPSIYATLYHKCASFSYHLKNIKLHNILTLSRPVIDKWSMIFNTFYRVITISTTRMIECTGAKLPDFFLTYFSPDSSQIFTRSVFLWL